MQISMPSSHETKHLPRKSKFLTIFRRLGYYRICIKPFFAQACAVICWDYRDQTSNLSPPLYLCTSIMLLSVGTRDQTFNLSPPLYLCTSIMLLSVGTRDQTFNLSPPLYLCTSIMLLSVGTRDQTFNLSPPLYLCTSLCCYLLGLETKRLT